MRKYLRFVSQSVLGMLGLSVYILADTFFIANYIGADGLASLNLALPIYGIINGTGLLIGIGGGVRYTLRHTRGDENADSVFTASLLMGAVLSFVYVLRGGASGKIAWCFRHGFTADNRLFEGLLPVFAVFYFE
mgnify:CR=1 FL=1